MQVNTFTMKMIHRLHMLGAKQFYFKIFLIFVWNDGNNENMMSEAGKPCLLSILKMLEESFRMRQGESCEVVMKNSL